MGVVPCLVCVIAAFFVMVIAEAHCAIRQQKEIGRLKAEVEKQQKNLAYLVRHSEEIAEIKRNEGVALSDVSGAKTDEEIADVIDTVINANNKRVRDH